jgi:hypothetical protein
VEMVYTAFSVSDEYQYYWSWTDETFSKKPALLLREQLRHHIYCLPDDYSPEPTLPKQSM